MTDLLELLETLLHEIGRFAKVLGGVLFAFLILRWALLKRRERSRIVTPSNQLQERHPSNQPADEHILTDDFSGEISASQIEVAESKEELRILVRWNNQLIRSVGSFVGICCLLVFSLAALGNVGVFKGEQDVSLVGFLVCSLVSVASFYCILAMWLNRTIVATDDLAVAVSAHPFPVPWFGKRIARSEIEQLYVQEIRNRSVSSSDWIVSYEVWVLTRDGERSPLLDVGKATGQRWGKQTGVDAKFIEAKVEERLQIVDSPVDQEPVERFHGTSGGGEG